MINKANVACLGYSVFAGKLERITFSSKVLINTLNQYSHCIAEKDEGFKKALMKSDILLPDGIGIVIAAKLLYRKKIRKIAGADIHKYLLNKLNNEHGSCFYMGSSQTTLDSINLRMSKEYPNIKVGLYSPPFKPVFDTSDNTNIIKAINQFQPDVLFVGMTAPKQEKWSFKHKDDLDAKIICSIGAVFDFYAGSVKRPNQIWINLGLEWLGRLIKEPKRMWKRYIYYGFIFAKNLITEKWKITIGKTRN